MPTFFFLFCHLSFDARGWVGPEESHALSQADLFDPKKNKGESFLHWCVGLHGGASAAGGRQAIYCGHARGQARRPLATWHAERAALSTYGESQRTPARHDMQVSQQPAASARQSKGGRNARKARLHQQAIGLRLRLFAGARPTQVTDPPACCQR